MSPDSYSDDASIVDSAALWPRIPPWHIIFDENLGTLRPSKAAFDNGKDGSPMSVVLADLVIASGRGPHDVLMEYADFALASLTAGMVRSKQQGILRDPTPEEPAHALVFGRKTDSVKRALAKASLWIVPPSEASRQP
jgi:hypothetical protein